MHTDILLTYLTKVCLIIYLMILFGFVWIFHIPLKMIKYYLHVCKQRTRVNCFSSWRYTVYGSSRFYFTAVIQIWHCQTPFYFSCPNRRLSQDQLKNLLSWNKVLTTNRVILKLINFHQCHWSRSRTITGLTQSLGGLHSVQGMVP